VRNLGDIGDARNAAVGLRSANCDDCFTLDFIFASTNFPDRARDDKTPSIAAAVFVRSQNDLSSNKCDRNWQRFAYLRKSARSSFLTKSDMQSQLPNRARLNEMKIV
jgi:hypothetical protein